MATADKLGAIMIIVGWLLSFAGFACTGTVQRFSKRFPELPTLIVFIGVVCHSSVLMYLVSNLPQIRELHWVRKNWGTRVHFAAYFGNFLLSSLPLLLPSVDYTWFMWMLGMPMFTFGLEWRLRPTTSLNLFPVALGVSMCNGFVLLKDELLWVRLLATYFVVVQPFVYCMAFIRLMVGASSLPLRVKLAVDDDVNLLIGENHQLVLSRVATDLSSVQEESRDPGQLLPIERVGPGEGGGTNIFRLENVEAATSTNVAWFDLWVISLTRLLRWVGKHFSHYARFLDIPNMSYL